ncbi:MAG: hypothetical protein CVV61_04130 [Tenericutes bacterium HGW-Tenericutes-6]|nr:MAG: hypothetical protein CVV61_04130 [Tenericutes bacterium HGW-Tenericutes-6]
MELLLMILPLAVILFFLIRKKHMLVAGLVGGVVAIIVSWILVATGTLEAGIKPADINRLVINVGVTDMLSKYLAPVIYAAGAVMIARSGSIKAFIEALNRVLKGKLAYLAAAIVIVQGLATYMAGMGAGNTMVIAPLMAAAVGFVPEVVAAMAIATAVGFTTSPASTETAFTATAAGMEVGDFANMMIPFTIVVYILAAALAFWGVHKRGSALTSGAQAESEYKDMPTKQLWTMVIPTIAFLLLVILGGKINQLFPVPFFLPFINVLIAAILCVIFCKVSPDKVSENLIDGSRYILTTLFGVGLFLGFINMVGFLGTFSELAALVGNAPSWLVIFVACVFAFLIAIPSGAFAAGVLTLILPTLALIPGLSPLGFGLIAISVGLGTQISPVQINVAALSEGFKVSIFDIVKNNTKFVLVAFSVIALVGLIVGFF